jgi:hypothetical protein
VRLSLKSTSTRTFVVWPALVVAEQLIVRRPVRVSWLPLLPWGYLQYRWSGAYRSRLGGGGPGMSHPPDRIVTTGIYGWTRNPMYLGHQIFLAGLALTTRSPLATALFVAHIPWFAARVRRDEQALEAGFGAAYESYRRSVPRWVLGRRSRSAACFAGPGPAKFLGRRSRSAACFAGRGPAKFPLPAGGKNG